MTHPVTYLRTVETSNSNIVPPTESSPQNGCFSYSDTFLPSLDCSSTVERMKIFVRELFNKVYDNGVKFIRWVTCGWVCSEELSTQGPTPPESRLDTEYNRASNEPSQQVSSSRNPGQYLIRDFRANSTYDKMMHLLELFDMEGSEEEIKHQLKIEGEVSSAEIPRDVRRAIALQVESLQRTRSRTVNGEAFIQENPKDLTVKQAIDYIARSLPEAQCRSYIKFLQEPDRYPGKGRILNNLVSLNLVHRPMGMINNFQISDHGFWERDFSQEIKKIILDPTDEMTPIINLWIGAYQRLIGENDFNIAKDNLLENVRSENAKEAAAL